MGQFFPDQQLYNLLAVGAHAALQTTRLNAGNSTWEWVTGIWQDQSYANPSWITALAGSKITGNISGNAGSITGAITESQVTGLVSDLGAIVTSLGLKAPLASPALTGTPTVPTASPGTNTTQAASTAFVLANLPAVPVQSVFGRVGSVTAQSGDYSVAQITGAAPLASPTFTGVVTVPSLILGTPLGLSYGGTGQATANAAFNALAPSQTGNTGKYLTSNGTDTSWGTVTVPLGADPSASVGLSTVVGTALSFMRSDGAPALSQAIAPTWTGLHTFNGSLVAGGYDGNAHTGGYVSAAGSIQCKGNSYASFSGASVEINFDSGTDQGGLVSYNRTTNAYKPMAHDASLHKLLASGTEIFRVGATTQTALVTVSSASLIGLTVKGAPSQSANLQEWQNSSGTALTVINSAGWMGLGTSTLVQPLTVSFARTSNSGLVQFDNSSSPASGVLSLFSLSVASTIYGDFFAQPSGGALGDGTAQVGVVSRSASLPMTFVVGGFNVERMRITAGGLVGIGVTPTAWLHIVQPAATSGTPNTLIVAGGAHTTLTAATEAIDVNVNLARTVQFATGALTTQRAVVIRAPTYGFVGASTITAAATVAITGAPVAGTNATITNPMALWVQGGTSQFYGNVGIGVNPGALLHVFSSSSSVAIPSGGVAAFESSGNCFIDVLCSSSTSCGFRFDAGANSQGYVVYDGSAGANQLRFGAGATDRLIIKGSNGGVGINCSPSAQLHVVSAAAGTIGQIVKGAASQSANLLEIQNSSAAVLFSHDKLGRSVTANTTPTIGAGTGAGTTPTVSISGTDVNGTVTVTTGTLPTGAATVVTVTFQAAYGSAPKTVMLTPANALAAALSGLTMVYVGNLTTTTWDVVAGATGLAGATTYVWYYSVLG